jgi:hypothetical protein
VNLTEYEIRSVLFGPHGRVEEWNLTIRISYSVWSSTAKPGGRYFRKRGFRKGRLSFVRGVGLCAEVGFNYLVPRYRGLPEVVLPVEKRLSRGLISVRGGSASCAGVDPFAEIWF